MKLAESSDDDGDGSDVELSNGFALVNEERKNA